MTRPPEDLYTLPDLYDAQYRSYREDLAFYRRLAEDHGGPVLEVGCGTGRVTVELARFGVHVTGVDIAPEMIARARQRIEDAGVSSKVTLIQADMRSLRDLPGLDERRGFSLAIAPFNTLMHAHTLEDQDLVFEGVHAALAPGGAFACDVYTPRFGQMGVVRREPTWDAVLGADADLFLVQEHDEVRQLITSTYLIDRVDASGHLRRQRARLVQRYYTRFELERAVLAAGFVDVQVYGSFERVPLRASSEVIAVVARKPKR